MGSDLSIAFVPEVVVDKTLRHGVDPHLEEAEALFLALMFLDSARGLRCPAEGAPVQLSEQELRQVLENDVPGETYGCILATA
jgi:hypothetical protein